MSPFLLFNLGMPDMAKCFAGYTEKRSDHVQRHSCQDIGICFDELVVLFFGSGANGVEKTLPGNIKIPGEQLIRIGFHCRNIFKQVMEIFFGPHHYFGVFKRINIVTRWGIIFIAFRVSCPAILGRKLHDVFDAVISSAAGSQKAFGNKRFVTAYIAFLQQEILAAYCPFNGGFAKKFNVIIRCCHLLPDILFKFGKHYPKNRKNETEVILSADKNLQVSDSYLLF